MRVWVLREDYMSDDEATYHPSEILIAPVDGYESWVELKKALKCNNITKELYTEYNVVEFEITAKKV